MPWCVKELTSVRLEFVELASKPERNMRELCRRFGISPTVGYKWLKRFVVKGVEGLEDQSRRPRRSPNHTPVAVEQLIIELRQKHPAWGARKLQRRLADQGHSSLPATSTITDILHRHDLIGVQASDKAQRWQRFERSGPNELWQIDFKGHFGLNRGYCHPLCALDDHSRYNVMLSACADQTGDTVRRHLVSAFRRYGLPNQVLWDNGSPWGHGAGQHFTQLDIWLMRLGVRVTHGRPYHPQTQGKEERFHRTLKAEVLNRGGWVDCEQVQRAFDAWRPIYNTERPHDSLQGGTPISRYQVSQRTYPEELPLIEYDQRVQPRKVDAAGWISYRGRDWKVGRAFIGLYVGVRPTDRDGIYEIIFLTQVIKELDLRQPNTTVPSTDTPP